MHDESVQMDIRRLLKTFGVQADTAIIQHLQRHPDIVNLRLRIRLEDLSEYSEPGIEPLAFYVEGEVKRGE